MDKKLQELLDKLSPEDLREAKTYIEYRTTKSTGGETSPKDYLYWQALCRALQTQATADAGSLRAFLYGYGSRPGYGHTKYRRVVAFMETFISAGTPNKLTKAQLLLLVTTCFQAVAARLQFSGAPVVPSSVLNAVETSLEISLNFMFPGYYRARMLGVLATGDMRRA